MKTKETEEGEEDWLRATDLKKSETRKSPHKGKLSDKRSATSFALFCYKLCRRKEMTEREKSPSVSIGTTSLC